MKYYIELEEVLTATSPVCGQPAVLAFLLNPWFLVFRSLPIGQ